MTGPLPPRGTLPPVRRRLFTLCSACSLLLCVAVCVMWPLSYWRSPWFETGVLEGETTRDHYNTVSGGRFSWTREEVTREGRKIPHKVYTKWRMVPTQPGKKQWSY